MTEKLFECQWCHEVLPISRREPVRIHLGESEYRYDDCCGDAACQANAMDDLRDAAGWEEEKESKKWPD